MQHLQPNTTLQGGKYKIERVLGQGGFGITYLAVQTSLQRKVAIKEFFMKDLCSRDKATCMMSAPSTGSSKLVEQYRKKFIKEARNLAKLNHPNIISVIDVFEENGTVYYTMPYLVGGSLLDYVKAHGTLSETVAMKYVKQIAGALKYMHEEQHICHFDVKPANILLDDKGKAVLIDFGISKNYDAAGQETTSTPVGLSEGYAPIEQYQQNVEEFSPVSDVYALGATLYFLLHGKRPVSAVHRAGGTALLMSKQLSQGIKDIINASMKVSKRERAKSVDVFMGNVSSSTYRKSTVVQDDDESTILEGSQRTQRTNSTYKQSHVSSSSRNTTVTDSNSNSMMGWIIGIAVVVIIGGFIYLKDNKEIPESTIPINSPSIDSTEIVSKEDSKIDIFGTSKVRFKKNYDGVNVEIDVDYPVSGNEELLGKTRLFVSQSIGKWFNIDIRYSDLPNGQSLVDNVGKSKYEEMKKEKVGENSYEWIESIKIQKSYENEKYVSFCANYYYCHGGVANEFCNGATFRKADGKQIVVLKDPYNTDLWLLLKQAVEKKLGSDYEMVYDDYKSGTLPKEIPHLSRNGVQFDYQHYEIGPGVLGQISVVIPYGRIKKYMSDEAIHLIE